MSQDYVSNIVRLWERSDRHSRPVDSKPPEQDGAAGTTVEALMYGLRERGIAALSEPNTQRRLSELSESQVLEVVARLNRLRPNYPAITDALIIKLGEGI